MNVFKIGRIYGHIWSHLMGKGFLTKIYIIQKCRKNVL